MHGFATAPEVRLARAVCQEASRKGFKLREVRLPGIGSRFDWLLPSGKILHGAHHEGRQIALARSCELVAPHLA